MASWDPVESVVEEFEALEGIVQPDPAPSVAHAEQCKTEKCAVCGEDVDLAEAKSCMADLCHLGKFLHEGCVAHSAVDGCEEYFCCARHLDAHHENVHQ